MTGSHSWRRRGLPLLGGAVLLLSLAACGDDSTSSGATTVVSGGATTTAAASGGSTTTAAAAGGASTTAGSSAEWDKVVEAAKKEGKVTIYSSQGLDQLNDFAAKFEEEYGITVEVVRGIDGDLLPGRDREADRQRHRRHVRQRRPGVRGRHRPRREGGSSRRRARLRLRPTTTRPYYTSGNYFEVGAAMLTFGWNTELFPKGLNDYPDLLDPELGGGKIGVIEPDGARPSWTSTSTSRRTSARTSSGAGRARSRASTRARCPWVEALTSGEIAAGSFVHRCSSIGEGQGRAGRLRSGAETALGRPLLRHRCLATGPHPNAAQLLANFMVTPEGQEVVRQQRLVGAPRHPGHADHQRQGSRAGPERAARPRPSTAYVEKWNSLFK